MIQKNSLGAVIIILNLSAQQHISSAESDGVFKGFNGVEEESL